MDSFINPDVPENSNFRLYPENSNFQVKLNY